MPLSGFLAGGHRPIRRDRAVVLVVVLIVEALIIFAILRFAFAPPPPRRTAGSLSTFDIAAPKAATATTPKRSATGSTPVASPVKVPKAVVPRAPSSTPDMVVVSKEDFAASDIGALKKAQGGASGAAYGPGEGPGGKTLYPAEWYVEPSRTALAAYLPNGAPEGSWAMIACRTIENYQVDNCYGLGQSQQGLSSALRQAAWQFRVRPPRVDGKPLVGAWVRIRFDFNKDGRD